jgi:hypothetical protein
MLGLLVKYAAKAVTDAIADDPAERSEKQYLYKAVRAKEAAVRENAREQQRHVAFDGAQGKDREEAPLGNKFIKLLFHTRSARAGVVPTAVNEISPYSGVTSKQYRRLTGSDGVFDSAVATD